MNFKNRIGTRSIRNNIMITNVALSFSYGIIMDAMQQILREELEHLITFDDNSITIDNEVKTGVRMMKPKINEIKSNKPCLYVKSSLYNSEDTLGFNTTAGFQSILPSVEPTTISDLILSSDDRIVGINDKFYIGMIPETQNLNMEFSIFDDTLAKLMNFKNGWKRIHSGLAYYPRDFELSYIIPQKLIDYWVVLHMLDPSDNESVLSSLQCNSEQRIFYEIVTETNNYEYIIKVPTRLQFKPEFINVPPEFNKKGNVVDNAFITRGLRVILNVPTSFVLSLYGVVDWKNVDREIEYRKNNPLTQVDTDLETGFKEIAVAEMDLDDLDSLNMGYYSYNIKSLWEEDENAGVSNYVSTIDKILTDDTLTIDDNLSYKIINDNHTDLISYGAMIDFTTGELMLPYSVVYTKDELPNKEGLQEDGEIHPYKSKSIKIFIYLNMTLMSSIRKDELLNLTYRNKDINKVIV